MQLHQAATGQISPAALTKIENTLEKTSQVLGMFESYDALAQKNGTFEAMLDTDHITLAVLEDLHDRASSLLDDPDKIADAGHTSGYFQIMGMVDNDGRPDLTSLRRSASDIITQGWNLEEDVPQIGLVFVDEIEDPFAAQEPDFNEELDTIDF